jgi:hypothetical protein
MKRHIFGVDEKNATEMWPGSELVFVKRLYRPATGTCLTRGDLMSEKRREIRRD